MTDNQELPQEEWSRTRSAVERIKDEFPWLYEEPSGEARHGFFADRRIIGRDTPINEGVYVGAGPREAIVVDDQKYPKELTECYQELRARMDAENKKPLNQTKRPTLGIVFDIAQEKLGGNLSPGRIEEEVNAMVGSFLRGGRRDVKVNLNFFIKAGFGVCRHRALLSGYLMEKLIRDGVIGGKVSVDRSQIAGLGAHSWTRWDSSTGKVFIIDPALGYWGPIEEAPKFWAYERP